MFKTIKRFITNNPILILIAISLATRFFWLFFGMPSVTNDEADIYTSSYLFGRTLKDYYGNLGFLTSGILTAKPSIPIYIGALPWFFTATKSVLIARLPFVLLNSASPVLFYLLIRKLTKNHRLPILAFFVLNFSPWFSYPSATGYEAMVALFFILLFFLITISRLDEKQKAVSAMIVGFCAFNSYMGMKPVFPFILLTGSLFYFGAHNTALTKKIIIKALVSTLILYSIFIGVNYVAPNASLVKREYQIMLNYYEKPKIEGMVWFERWTSTGPDKLITLLSNKYTIRLRDYAAKYLLSFNPQLFFLKGDPSSLYGTADLSGLFFLTDFIFLIAGLFFLRTMKEKGLQLLLLLFFFGGLPITLSNTSPTFILRGVILLIPYSLIIAYGMEKAMEKYKKVLPLLVFLFIINSCLYYTMYSVRIMNLNGEQWKYTIKLISERIAKLKDNYSKVTIYNIEAQETFFQYAFYVINDPSVIKDHMMRQDFTYGNLVITNGCPKNSPAKDELVVFNKENCGKPGTGTKILHVIEPRDRSGKDYYIFSGS